MRDFRWLGPPALVFLGAWLLFAESSLESKLGELKERYERGSETAKDFAIEETEANGFLRGTQELPKGIENPWIRFEENVAIVGAMVDLDQVRGELPDSTIFQLLSGRVPVEVTTRVSGTQGEGQLELERVLMSGVELPMMRARFCHLGSVSARPSVYPMISRVFAVSPVQCLFGSAPPPPTSRISG